jgi:GNAT superfamily N-acetyltransferase
MYNPAMIDIKIFGPSLPEHFDAVRQLFREYINFLYGLPNMRIHVDMEGPDAELAELEKGRYAPPDGAILLAMHNGEFIGAVALRKLTDEVCEMKRLYVRPQGRGASVGLQLAQQIIQQGREKGYRKMRLDTHPAMTKAHQLYYSLGFFDIQRYNQNMVPGALFMELDLKQKDSA